MDSGYNDSPTGLTLPTLRFAWFAAIAIILLFVFAMIYNPWLGYGLGITALIVFVACFFPVKEVLKRLPGYLVLLTVVGVLVLIALPNSNPMVKARDAEVKQNLHAIQLALERYAVDYGTYPVILDDLRNTNDMPVFPKNPYFSRGGPEHEGFRKVRPRPEMPEPDSGFNYENIITGEILTEDEYAQWRNMRNVSFTDQRFAGDFTYLPKLSIDDAGNPVADGYTLLAYGLAKYGRSYRDHLYGGRPLDHVILVLEDGGRATSNETGGEQP